MAPPSLTGLDVEVPAMRLVLKTLCEILSITSVLQKPRSVYKTALSVNTPSFSSKFTTSSPTPHDSSTPLPPNPYA